MRPVRLARVPAAVLVASDDHLRTLVRELQLIRIGEEGGTTERQVPPGILQIVEIVATYRSEQDAARALAADALAKGDEHVDVELLLPVEASATVERLHELLEQADELCESGAILTLPSSPAVRDLRRSLHRQVMDQLRAVSSG